ncbi:MAG: ceramidase domain-containing protein [Bryobacterales bacterium]|nr:ceramidase domain-containing protein [Bryobacterales bacterium]
MRWRLGVLAGVAAAAIVFALASAPIVQDPAYHRFADQRAFFGIPNFWNVTTNLLFCGVGVYGLRAWRRARWESDAHRWPWLITALGSLLIGCGSGYYHAMPDNQTLFWDRLPMTLAFMGVLSAVIAERIHTRAGVALLAPFLVLGMLSVEVWRRGELTGVGDLRFYALVQFYPMAALPLILWMFPSRYTEGGGMWQMAGMYGGAKVFEWLDAGIYAMSGGVMSGHSLKHVAAAGALWAVFRMVGRRSPLGEGGGGLEFTSGR